MAKRLSWAERIERAKKRGKFTSSDMELVNSWATCAVGERHGWRWSLPTYRSREDRLGMGFTYAVENNRIKSAEFIYGLIQKLPPVEAQP